jgi:hypothetical protein
MYILAADVNNINQGPYITSWDDRSPTYGTITVTGQTTGTTLLLNMADAITVTTGARTEYSIPVTWISGTIPSTATQVVVTFARDGQYGATGASGATGLGFRMDSVTTVSLTTGTKTFTVNQLGAYATNMRVRASVNDGVNPDFMEGRVTAINTTTPSLTMSADFTTGTTGASYSNWAFSPTGEIGATGFQGIQGNAGATGLGYLINSTSAVAMATTGTKTFVVDQLGAYIPTMRVRAGVNDGVNSDFMEGRVTTINTTTPSLTMSVDTATGSIGVTYSVWSFSAAGEIGAPGLMGATGAVGATGVGYDNVTSTSTVFLNVNQDARFTVNQQGAFKNGSQVRAVALDSLSTGSFIEGYLIPTGTNWTIVPNNVFPANSPTLNYSNWHFTIGGTFTTSTVFPIRSFSTAMSTSTSTGAIQLAGGIGMGGSLFVGQWVVPQNVSSATIKSYVGTPTGATVFLTGAGYNKPAYWDGTKWYTMNGNALY